MQKFLYILQPFERDFIMKYAQSDVDRFKMTAEHLINNNIMVDINEAIRWKNILIQYATTQEMREYVNALI